MDSIFAVLSLELNTLILSLYFFGIPHHLKTFFQPFRRMTISSQSPGTNINELAEVISFNMVSTGIGMVMRTLTIFIGLVCTLLLLLVYLLTFPLVLLFWPAWLPLVRAYQKNKQLFSKELLSQAKLDPEKTLKTLLTTTDLGRFLTKKLVLESTDFEKFEKSQPYKPTSEPTSLESLIVSMAKDFAPFSNLLEQRFLGAIDISRVCFWYSHLSPQKTVNIFDLNSLKKISGIGATWSYGYTNTLNKFQITQNYSQFPTVVGRDRELDQISKTLSKTTQNSIIIVGEAGIGRHVIVDEFSRRLANGQLSDTLSGYHTTYLDLNQALSGQSSASDQQKTVLNLLEEAASAGNVILVIDNIDKVLSERPDQTNLINSFSQALSDGKLKTIGITTKELFDKHLAQNTTLLKLFSILQIEPPDIETVYEEMELSIVPVLEKNHHVSISYPAIKDAIESADRFISDIPFPEKSINLLDETITAVKEEHPHMNTLWSGDIQKYLSEKTHIPLGAISQKDNQKLTNLESILHERVVGQDEAVNSLAKALRRSVLALSTKTKPIGTFLFLGPTGVGKTETAKALCECYFGSDSRLLRFDMSQYQGEEGLEKLIGSSHNNTTGQFTSKLSTNPFSVLLFDEIEKASPMVLNLFLTLIDEAYITDALGRKVSARQNIIIGTSNAGSLLIKESVEKGLATENLSTKLLDYLQQEKIFSPEFLNRFDGIIVFKPLSDEQIKIVVEKQLNRLAKSLAAKKINLKFSGNLVEQIISEGYDPAFGARSVQRYIQNNLEDKIAQKLLASPLPPGSTLEL